MRHVIPLGERRADWLILAFFWLNIVFITYIVDIEQLIIVDPYHFSYPIWPPAFILDAIHWWGRNFDPLLMARPVWWKMTIWFDDLIYGPFYIVAIYAYTRGKEWIRIPSIIYATMMITGVTVILGEEAFGPHKAPQFIMVLAANAAWLILPAFIIYRMWSSEHPFTRAVSSSADGAPVAAATQDLATGGL